MIIVDLETSGLDERKHSILSIGAVEYNNAENFFYSECRLREGAEVEDEALRKNGFTLDYINSRKKSCEELVRDFREWALRIEDRTFAGMVPSFDIKFLRSNFELYGLEWIFRYRCIDLHSAFYVYLAVTNQQMPLKDGVLRGDLDFILEHLGINGRTLKFHNALEDARLTREAFYTIISRLSKTQNPAQ